jgi:steroid 5-alpha reductase family enzyme
VFDLRSYGVALAALLVAATLCWLVSVPKRDVSIVDSLWGALFVAAAGVYVAGTGGGPRAWLVFVLIASWALRLTVYITWRNWGEGEDHRYRAIRRRNEPKFWLKSLYLVFGLQAVLAWIVSLPLLAAVGSSRPLGWIDALGVAVFAFGFGFESLGDWQLARFRADAANRGRVLDRGLWRYTRHPNYFGECCLWWGLYLIAVAAGGWWSIVSPLLMTLLLLKVSGVALLEQTIVERRPGYVDYVRRTSAFVPLPRRKPIVARAVTEL